MLLLKCFQRRAAVCEELAELPALALSVCQRTVASIAPLSELPSTTLHSLVFNAPSLCQTTGLPDSRSHGYCIPQSPDCHQHPAAGPLAHSRQANVGSAGLQPPNAIFGHCRAITTSSGLNLQPRQQYYEYPVGSADGVQQSPSVRQAAVRHWRGSPNSMMLLFLVINVARECVKLYKAASLVLDWR